MVSQSAVPHGSNAEILDRLPPQNLDAERGVLGSLLLDSEMCDDVALVLRPEFFYSDANQKLYSHLIAMHTEGRRIDTTLLVERLKQAGDLDAVGGRSYLAEVVESVPLASHAVYYANIVQEKAVLRSLIHASTEILRDAYDPTLEARELLNRAEERMFAIRDQRETGEVATINQVLLETFDQINARLGHEGGIGGKETGFSDLDQLTGGLHDSELIILAARPSMGKTALATNIAEHAAVKCNVTTLFVSLEMSRLELAQRMLCARGRINGHKLRNGFISAIDRKKLIEASAQLSQAPMFIDDNPSRTMTEIAAEARRLKRKQKLGLIVIDYLQLIEPENLRDPRQEQVARIARRLKGMARELKVPVVCLAQLNRQAEVSRDNRPRLSHLRESGAIEQDADVVMFVHREEYYQTTDEDRQRVAGEAEIIVAKQRNGPVGEVKLLWRQDFTRFENLDRRHEEFAESF